MVENQAQTNNKIKSFRELSYLLHNANEIDDRYSKGKSPNLKVGYQVALPFCIEKLESGFMIDLYGYQEFPQVLFWLESFYNQMKNNYLQRSNTEIIMAMRDLSQNSNNAQALSMSIGKLTKEEAIILWECLQSMSKMIYAQSVRILMDLLLNKGLIPIYGNEKVREKRFRKKFKCFEDCIFIEKRFTFEDYQEQYKEDVQEEEEEKEEVEEKEKGEEEEGEEKRERGLAFVKNLLIDYGKKTKRQFTLINYLKLDAEECKYAKESKKVTIFVKFRKRSKWLLKLIN